MMRLLSILWGLPLAAAMGERINHEGRILGPQPQVTAPLLFNTPQADAVVSAMQVMPRDSAWNEDVSLRPPLTNSNAMIARVKADLAADRQNLRLLRDMNFALVPDAQPTVPITFVSYPDDSDYDGGTAPTAQYPIPPEMPVEGWPTETNGLTNANWQQNINNEDSDRHSIVVKPGAGFFWEMYQAKRVGTAWQAANGAKWNLASNTLRPFDWLSADSSGMPVFPAIVRYDECQRGMVEHALRLIVKHTRVGPVYPATHDSSNPTTSSPDTPAMGQRFRLKPGFVIPANWSIQEKAVLLALKKYGAIVSDNGSFFSVSITPDDRYPQGCFDHIANSIDINNFEVIQTTAETAGPRSPGAPTADAGPDLWRPIGTTPVVVNLAGNVGSPGAPAIQWKLYSGPAAVGFGNAALASTTATFGVPGTYTLLLAATDGVHPVAYDAAVITITLSPTVTPAGNDIHLDFPTVVGHHYLVQKSTDLAAWSDLTASLTGNGGILTVIDAAALGDPAKRRFYRVRVLD